MHLLDNMTPNLIYRAFFIVGTCAFLSNTLQYSDLEELGVELCPLKNSCPQVSSMFHERICECDSSCAFYKDCCIDAGRGRPKRVTTQICMPYGVFPGNGVYMFAECPSRFRGPAEVRHQCKNGDPADPLLNAPVTDTLKRRTYLNSYCALCHEASPTSLVTWQISACKIPSRTKVDADRKNLIYREDRNEWGIMQDGAFKSCEFGFDKPPSIDRYLRFCRPDLVSSCPGNSTDDALRSSCESYMSVVRDSNKVKYRNPHCALCNAVPATDIECPDLFELGRGSKPFTFALLFDINRKDGDLVGVKNSCGPGEKYDPFFEKCRKLVCAVPGYTMVAGKCVKQE